ncbi:MAG: DUF3313 family protein [Gammaproteobacteria bacterium]|nr:MAG: DUF3313 family protein [Gammaproteobacteria bacterium]
MKQERNEPNRLAIAAVMFSSALLLSASPGAFAQEQELAGETYDGLTLVPDSKVAVAYIDPDADFSIYDKIIILDCTVAFRKDWQRDHKQAGSRIRISSRDMEKIKADVADLFREVFTEKLSGDGGYKIVDTAGDDVLLVRPAIIDLDITAPDTMSAGRSYTYTSSAGAATIYIELFDSVTGDILARAADRKVARKVGGYMSYSSRLTNRAEARRMLGSWAELLRDRLDEFHGK